VIFSISSALRGVEVAAASAPSAAAAGGALSITTATDWRASVPTGSAIVETVRESSKFVVVRWVSPSVVVLADAADAVPGRFVAVPGTPPGPAAVCLLLSLVSLRTTAFDGS
jgi:hypothetical protein